jgi:pSer/pThr/pTyr-binding forkhead associated (FHA) protein
MTGIVLLILRILLTLALYAFLGWAFWTIWRDLRRQENLLVNQQTPQIELRITDGDLVSEWIEYQGPEIIIGRDPTCECPLQSETVSATHARLAFHHKQWWLEDLNSTNGTFVNSIPVTSPIVVTNDDQIRCGDVILTMRLGKFGQ